MAGPTIFRDQYLSPSPRSVLGDVKNQVLLSGKSRTPTRGRRETLLTVPEVKPMVIAGDQQRPAHPRRYSSVLPQDAKEYGDYGASPTLVSRPTHARRFSIPKSPMLAFGPVTPGRSRRNTLNIAQGDAGISLTPKAVKRVSAPASSSKKPVRTPASSKRKSFPAAVFTPMPTKVPPIPVQAALVSPSTASAGCRTPGAVRLSHGRRLSIPKSPLLDLSSLRVPPANSAMAPRTPRSGFSAHIVSADRGAVWIGADTAPTHQLRDDEDQRRSLPDKKLGSGVSTATLKLNPAAFHGPDATSLFLSTASFAALKTPRIARDDTCDLPFIAVTSESPSFLLMETPSFAALSGSQSRPISSPPSYYDLTPTRGPTSDSYANTRMLFDDNESAGRLCATPFKENKEDKETTIDKGHLHPPATNGHISGSPCPVSQSRSILSLMSELEQATPSLGRSLFTEAPDPAAILAGAEDDSFEVGPPPVVEETGLKLEEAVLQNMGQETMTLLDEFETLAVEMRTLPLPRPPPVSPQEWVDALGGLQAKGESAEGIHQDHEEPCLTPKSCATSFAGQSDDSHETQDSRDTVNTDRPSLESERTVSPSPPSTPIDQCFPADVHINSPHNDTLDSIVALYTPGSVSPEGPHLRSKSSAAFYPAPASPPTYEESIALDVSRPPSRASVQSSPPRISTASPIPTHVHDTISHSSSLSSLTVTDELPLQPMRSISPSPSVALAVTPSTGLKRLFKPRPSTPSSTPAGPSSVNKMMKFVPTLRQERRPPTYAYGESFLEM